MLIHFLVSLQVLRRWILPNVFATFQKASIAQIFHVTLLQRLGPAAVAAAASKALPELPAAVMSACSGTLSKEQGQTGALKVSCFHWFARQVSVRSVAPHRTAQDTNRFMLLLRLHKPAVQDC